jgi:transcriptional coactivator HFI1/ADA1
LHANDCLLLIGQLNQNELSLRIDHFVTGEPATENLHNQLIAAIYGNLTRDLPDQGVAPWVSANEKPMALSKPVSGDAAEQRLKIEVMQLPARERRRLKEIPDVRELVYPFLTSSSCQTIVCPQML